MDMKHIRKHGARFRFNGVEFYNFLSGPGSIMAVVADRTLGRDGSGERKYAFAWYYDSEALIGGSKEKYTQEYAAQVLLAQYRYILVDHMSLLLRAHRLNERGRELAYDPESGLILINSINETYHRERHAA